VSLFSTTYAIALILPALSGAQLPPGGFAGADPLEPYVVCQYTADFSVVSTMRLPGLVPFADERKDFNLWATGASAKWSLASNARQHTLVVTILEGEKKTADKRMQEIIAELLTRDPALIKQEMAETYGRQKAAGKWR
jgi:hypothetical protein